jgi:hypothetical protein
MPRFLKPGRPRKLFAFYAVWARPRCLVAGWPDERRPSSGTLRGDGLEQHYFVHDGSVFYQQIQQPAEPLVRLQMRQPDTPGKPEPLVRPR